MEEYERTAEEVRLELEDKNEELQRELSMVQEHLKTITFDLQKNNEIKDKEISKLHNEIGKLDGEKKMLKTEFEEEFKRLSAENEASIEKLGLKIDQLSLELTEASKERVALTSERNNLASSLEKAEGNIAKLTANLKTTEEKAKVDLEQLNLKYKKDEN
jgi:chromosome segregation ATPase